MSCSCDDGVLRFKTSTWRTARKVHACEECGQAITCGERYRRDSGNWEGAMFSHALCAGCVEWGHALAEAARNAKECDCWTLGTLWTEAIPEFCREVLGYNPKPRRRVAGVAVAIEYMDAETL